MIQYDISVLIIMFMYTYFSTKYCIRSKQPMCTNLKEFVLLWISIISTVIIEESLFRCTLKVLLNDLYYNKLINASMFGLIHILNYFSTTNTFINQYTRILHCCIQSIACMYLGYRIFDLYLLHAIAIHLLYNILMLNMYYFCLRFHNKTSEQSNNILSDKCIFRDKYRRSKSASNLFAKHCEFIRLNSNKYSLKNLTYLQKILSIDLGDAVN